MKPTDLPKLGKIENTAHEDFLPYFGIDLHGKDVLAIGYNQWQLDHYIDKYTPQSVSVLSKWPEHEDAQVQGRQVIIGDAGDVAGVGKRQFDVVATFSVLEHIENIGQAFSNFSTALRTGGLFLAIFGPVWSSPYGHHLYIDVLDPRSNFCLWDMPAFLHLLCTPNELCDYYYAIGYGREQIELILHNIYDVKTINRIFYEDYVDRLNEHFCLAASRMFYNRLPRNVYDALRSKYPRYRDFSTYGGIWIAIKNDPA